MYSFVSRCSAHIYLITSLFNLLCRGNKDVSGVIKVLRCLTSTMFILISNARRFRS